MAVKTKRPAMTPEQRKAKVDGALATLETGVANLVESEGWQEYLTFAARFHRYSANNVLLIMVQSDGMATQVAGFQRWKALGRSVRKGERGLAILAPVRRTVEDKDTGEKRSWVGGFKVEYVFDVSQTDGDPLPDNPVSILTDGDNDGSAMPALVSQIMAAGFTFELEPTGSAANGWTDFAAKVVRVGSDLPIAQQVKTTAHELAHVLLHDPSDPDRPADRGLVEVEAESVAFVVLHALGFDAGDYSFGYVAGWSGGKAERVRTVAQRVQRTATRVLTTLSEEKVGA